jgi:cytochrome P450
MRNSPIEALTRDHFELPIMRLQTVVGTIVSVSEPSAVRHVLRDNASNYRKDVYQRDILAALGMRDGLLAAEDEQWRAQRRLLAPLFTPKSVAGFAGATAAAAQALVERWKARKDGQALDVAPEMIGVAVDVLQRTIFPGGFGLDPRELTRAVWHSFNTLGRLDPLDVFKAPQWVPRIGHLRARPALRLLAQMVETLIAAERRPVPSSRQAPSDLLDILLNARDPQNGQGLSTAEIQANILTFFVTGFESTANTLIWSLYLLSLDDEWRERLQAEVDRELPDGRHVEGCLERLTATRAVVEEVMRLYPPTPSITREAIGPDRLSDQDILPGTIVVVAPWVLHRHRLLWQEPDLFDPSRFLSEAREQIDRYAYLPFGAGPHTCIGMHFALQEIVIVLATIVRGFRFECAAGHPVWPVHRLSLRLHGGLPMTLHRRE